MSVYETSHIKGEHPTFWGVWVTEGNVGGNGAAGGCVAVTMTVTATVAIAVADSNYKLIVYHQYCICVNSEIRRKCRQGQIPNRRCLTYQLNKYLCR